MIQPSFSGTSAAAQRNQAAEGQTESETAQQDAEALQFSAETLMGRQVVNLDQQELGTVERIVTDGQQNYLVLSHGGFLGVGEDETIVPVDQVLIGPERINLVVDAESPQALQQETTVLSENVQDVPADQTVELTSQ